MKIKNFSNIKLKAACFIFFIFAPIISVLPKEKFTTGADELVSKKLDLVKGKRLGIVTNHTAILSNGTHLVDSLVNIPGVQVTALFGPEHGIRGDAPAGEKIESGN